jgi:hypothetical protein
MSCCVANATIDYNAVTIHTKPVDQQGFGGLGGDGWSSVSGRISRLTLGPFVEAGEVAPKRSGRDLSSWMSVTGLVSRVTPVQMALRNCTRDEGGPFEFGNQVLISRQQAAAADVASYADKIELSWKVCYPCPGLGYPMGSKKRNAPGREPH